MLDLPLDEFVQFLERLFYVCISCTFGSLDDVDEHSYECSAIVLSGEPLSELLDRAH